MVIFLPVLFNQRFMRNNIALFKNLGVICQLELMGSVPNS